MANWAANLALSGFHYSAVDKSISFTDKPGNYFWSNGYAWGTAKVSDTGIEILVDSGAIEIRQMKRGDLSTDLKETIVLNSGQQQNFRF